MLRRFKGQAISENVFLITIVVVVAVSLFAMIKRSTNSLIKVAADQIGEQQNAEQTFNEEDTTLLSLNSDTKVRREENIYSDRVRHSTIREIAESTMTTSNQLSNGGFRKDEE